MKKKRLYSIPCHLCGNNKYKILFKSTLQKKDFNHSVITEELKNTLGDYRKHSRIVKCLSCGLVYTNPIENPASLLEGYEDVVDEEYLQTEKYRKILHQEHLENIEKFKKKGKLLDIGCFAGYFLELGKKRGWDVYGIEPSNWAGGIAKKRKIKIIGKDIQKTKIKKNSFDAITMWDVIEHLANPKEILKKCYNGLDKGGIIALGTPDIECLVAKIMRSNYPYLVRMHHVFYSPKTLSKMLEDVGFKTVKIYTYGRTFPISYVVERIRINNVFYKGFKKLINALPIIANYQIHLNLGDSFAIIATK